MEARDSYKTRPEPIISSKHHPRIIFFPFQGKDEFILFLYDVIVAERSTGGVRAPQRVLPLLHQRQKDVVAPTARAVLQQEQDGSRGAAERTQLPSHAALPPRNAVPAHSGTV